MGDDTGKLVSQWETGLPIHEKARSPSGRLGSLHREWGLGVGPAVTKSVWVDGTLGALVPTSLPPTLGRAPRAPFVSP